MSAAQPVRSDAGVRVIGDAPVRPASAAEVRLAELVRDADDRSSGADPLRVAIARAGLERDAAEHAAQILDPLALAPGARVLEIGCGSGAVTRALGDRGMAVEALEGDLVRARIATARTLGLPEVRITCTTLSDWLALRSPAEPAYDVVLVRDGPGTRTRDGQRPCWDAAADLRFAASLLRPGGVLVVALDHRWGLGTLVGATLPEPGTGAPAVEGVGAMAAALAVAGLPAQRRLSAWPGIRRPGVVLDDALWSHPDGPALARILVREPVDPAEPRRTTTLAVTEAFAGMIAAGAGPATASASLLIAGSTPEDVTAALRPGAAWLAADPTRRRDWRCASALVGDADGWRLEPIDPPAPVVAGPFAWAPSSAVVAVGEPAEDLLVAAILAHGTADARVVALLRAWWAAVDGILDGEGGRALDIGPDRFVVLPDGTWQVMGDGLRSPFPVPPAALATSALVRLLSDRVLRAGVPAGASASETVRDLAAALAGAVGVEIDDGVVMLAIEHDVDRALRTGVTAVDRAALRRRERRGVEAMVGDLLAGLPLARHVGATAARLDAEEAAGRLESALAEAQAAASRTTDELARVRAGLDADLVQLRQRAERAEADGDRLRQELDGSRVEVARLRERVSSLEATSRAGGRSRGAPAHGAGTVVADTDTDTAGTRVAGAPDTTAVPPPARTAPVRRSATARLVARLTERSVRRTVAASGLFDGAWYRSRYPDVAGSGMDPLAHYIRHGWPERRDPGPGFDAADYLRRYPDVAAAGTDPVMHYLRHGRSECRTIRPVAPPPPPPQP